MHARHGSRSEGWWHLYSVQQTTGQRILPRAESDEAGEEVRDVPAFSHAWMSAVP